MKQYFKLRGGKRLEMAKGLAFRPSGVKRYSVQGVTYTYHKATGLPLPNLPFDHPRFSAALRSADNIGRTQSDSADRWGLMESTHGAGFSDFKPPKQPDAIAYSVPQIIKFIQVAKPGSVMFYHSGDLANDARVDRIAHDKQRFTLMASDFGVIALRQSRVGEQWRQYYALRTDESLAGIPAAAITGQITPDEYTALVAINERQASISITRVIRDALGISDAVASEWRATFINRGWLTNSRPPELTRLGLSLLA